MSYSIVKLSAFDLSKITTIGCRYLYNGKPFLLQTDRLRCQPSSCDISINKSSYLLKCKFSDRLRSVITNISHVFGASVIFKDNTILAIKNRGENDINVPCYRIGSNTDLTTTFRNFVKRTNETSFVCILEFVYHKKRNELLCTVKQIQYERNPEEDYHFIDDEEIDFNEIISDEEDEDDDNWL